MDGKLTGESKPIARKSIPNLTHMGGIQSQNKAPILNGFQENDKTAQQCQIDKRKLPHVGPAESPKKRLAVDSKSNGILVTGPMGTSRVHTIPKAATKQEEQPDFDPETLDDADDEIIIETQTEPMNGVTANTSDDCPTLIPSSSQNNRIDDSRLSASDLEEDCFQLTPNIPFPLCQCKIPPVNYNPDLPVARCQAWNSVDGRRFACKGRTDRENSLYRPHSRVPFRVFCETHILLLRDHYCCAICGIFCIKGKFVVCEKAKNEAHFSHESCVKRQESEFCPHCGDTGSSSKIKEIDVRKNGIKCAGQALPHARISAFAQDNPKRQTSSDSLDLKKTLYVPATGAVITADYVDDEEDKKLLCDAFDKINRGWEPDPKISFLRAVQNKDLETVLHYLSKGEEPSEILDTKSKNTALHIAAKLNHTYIVYVLCNAGTDLDQQNAESYTPLALACHKGHHVIVKVLVNSGADPSVKVHYNDTDGSTALHVAALNGHEACARFLISSRKIKINDQDDGGWTALAWATEHGQASVANLLLSKGAKPMLRDLEGNIVLHWAAFSGSTIIARRLVEIEPEAVNETNIFGDTPLHVASRQQHWNVVQILLENGGDVRKKNLNMETPESCIKSTAPGHIQAIAMLARVREENKHTRIKRIHNTDIAGNRESLPIQVINEIDTQRLPMNFKYVPSLVETVQIPVDRRINRFHNCDCKDDCSTGHCPCTQMSVQGNIIRNVYDEDRTLDPDFDTSMTDIIYECGVLCNCRVSSCRNRVAQHGISVRMEIAKTADRGWAVKVLENVRRGTFICEYAGELLTGEVGDSRDDDSYLFELGVDDNRHCIDAKYYGNVSRFINHSCNPNVMPVRLLWDHQDARFCHIGFFSSKDIQKGEEISFDYGPKFWIVKHSQFLCKCGSDNCKYSSETIGHFLANYKDDDNKQNDNSGVLDSVVSSTVGDHNSGNRGESSSDALSENVSNGLS